MMSVEARLLQCELENGNLKIEVKYFDGASVIKTDGFLIADNPLAAGQLKRDIAARVKAMEEKLAQAPVSGLKAGDIITSSDLEG